MSSKNKGDESSTFQSLNPSEFKAELVRKGWTYVELGERWAMSANWIARVGARASRPRYWDDAIRGLPVQGRGKSNSVES